MLPRPAIQFGLAWHLARRDGHRQAAQPPLEVRVAGVCGCSPHSRRRGDERVRVSEQLRGRLGSVVDIAAQHLGQRVAVLAGTRRGCQRQQQPGAERRGDLMPGACGSVQARGIAGHAASDEAYRQSHVSNNA
jgi:hypothetical protein